MRSTSGAMSCVLALILAAFTCIALSTIGAAAAWLLPASAVERKVAVGEIVPLVSKALANDAARSAGLAMTTWEWVLAFWLACIAAVALAGPPRRRWFRVVLIGSLIVAGLPALAGCLLGFGLLVGLFGSARPIDAELLTEGAYSTIGVMFAWAAAACTAPGVSNRSGTSHSN